MTKKQLMKDPLNTTSGTDNLVYPGFAGFLIPYKSGAEENSGTEPIAATIFPNALLNIHVHFIW